MKKCKTLTKFLAVMLVALMLLTSLPVGAFAIDVPETVADGITLKDVVAGAASVYDLYGEDYAVHIPDAAKTYDPTEDNRVRSEEGDSLNTIVINNGDGTNTMTIYDYPVKFINDKGEIEDISLELTDAENGAYKTKKNNIKTVFPQKAKDGISLSHEDVNIKLTPKFTKPLTDTLTFALSAKSENVKSKTATVEPIASNVNINKIDDEKISYYYDSSTRLEYSLTYAGFKEDIVVSEYTGQTEYAFTLETNGLTLKKTNGSYYLADKKGNTKAVLGEIIILTADGKNDTVGYMTHKEIEKNQTYELTIHVDAEWLSDENTAYPIRIDPTLELPTRDDIQDITIYSDADTVGNDPYLYVGYREGYGIARTLMKFPGMALVDATSSKNIRSAYVYLYDPDQAAAEMKVSCNIFFGNAWNEETSNWNNVNAGEFYHYLSQNRISYSRGNAKTENKHWYSFDILDYVKYCKEDTPGYINTGIVFNAPAQLENAGVNNYKRFVSFNSTAAQKPYVAITYDNGDNSNCRPFGWLDNVTNTYASGWAWCVDAPNEAVTVQIILKNESTGQTFEPLECIANRSRPDVAAAGYGTGRYGFKCDIDWSQYTPGRYTVTAKAIPPGAFASSNNCSVLLPSMSYTIEGYAGLLPSGQVYLNNREYGRYLMNNNGTADAQSGLLANLGGNIQWILTEFSEGYLLQNVADTTKMLAVPADYASDSVILSAPDVLGMYNYVWDIVLAGNGCFLKSRHNNRYLYIDANGNLRTRIDGGDYYLDQTTGTQVDTIADACWRIVSTSEYGNNIGVYNDDDAYAYAEYIYTTKIRTVALYRDVTNPIEAVSNTKGELLWAEASDFILTYPQNNIITVHDNNSITGNSEGEVQITAYHKITGIETTFKAVVCEYIKNVYVYYDQGFIKNIERTNNSLDDINKLLSNCIAETRSQYAGTLNIYIDFSVPTYYQSPLDKCKQTVTAENVENLCGCQGENHSTTDVLKNDFMSAHSEIDNKTTYMLFTSHKISNSKLPNTFNRSFCYGDYVFILETEFNLNNSNNEEDKWTHLISHELAHAVGADDHYHEVVAGVCVNKDRCTNEMCNPNSGYDDTCEMVSGNKHEDKWFCDKCIEDIQTHLTEPPVK